MEAVGVFCVGGVVGDVGEWVWECGLCVFHISYLKDVIPFRLFGYHLVKSWLKFVWHCIHKYDSKI